MNSTLEAKISEYLKLNMHYTPVDSAAIIDQVVTKARTAGYAIDERFAHAGLTAGPECKGASRLVARALGMSGDETSEYALKKELDAWVRAAPKTRAR